MVELQAILKYQEIDKKLYALERELAGCEERKEYLKTKKFLETAADKLDAFDAKAAQLKSAAVELTKKYLKTEDTLKDFAHLDELVAGGADIAFYKKNAMSIADQLKKNQGGSRGFNGEHQLHARRVSETQKAGHRDAEAVQGSVREIQRGEGVERGGSEGNRSGAYRRHDRDFPRGDGEIQNQAQGADFPRRGKIEGQPLSLLRHGTAPRRAEQADGRKRHRMRQLSSHHLQRLSGKQAA